MTATMIGAGEVEHTVRKVNTTLTLVMNDGGIVIPLACILLEERD